ncbi:MAG: hypothetical protein PHO02_04315 [Candidatus Nanoarchaeia archaeon]|nr:hypothetical protein [Candidatus Nanoarchaeia archaeon]
MKKIIILLLAVSLLLAGCQALSNIKLPKSLPGLSSGEDTGGSGSISAYFVNPKQGGSALKDYPFSPVVRIKSLGGYESDGQVCISGLDREIFSGFSGCECMSFKQEKDESGKFEHDDVSFGPYTLRIKQDDRKEHVVSSVTRFEYGNEIKANISISRDAYENTGCTASINSATSGPLVVGIVEQETIPITEDIVTLIFKIHASKAEEGRFILEENLNDQCTPLSSEKLPVIRARAKGFPTRAPVTCRDVEITGNDVTVVCEAKDISLIDSSGSALFGDNYSPEVIFELRYFFETTSSARFTVS